MKALTLLPLFALILALPAHADENMKDLANFNRHANVDCGDTQNFVGYNSGGLVQGGASWAGGGGDYLKFELTPDGYLMGQHQSYKVGVNQDTVQVRVHAYLNDELELETRYIIENNGKHYSASTFATVPTKYFTAKAEHPEIKMSVGIQGTVPEDVLKMKDADAYLQKMGFKAGEFIDREVHCYVNYKE